MTTCDEYIKLIQNNPDKVMKYCAFNMPKAQKLLLAADFYKHHGIENSTETIAVSATEEIGRLERTLPELIPSLIEKIKEEHEDTGRRVSRKQVRGMIRELKDRPDPVEEEKTTVRMPMALRIRYNEMAADDDTFSTFNEWVVQTLTTKLLSLK